MNDLRSGKVMTVTGFVEPHELGITDAHSHLWIEAVRGAAPGAPVLMDRPKILEELAAFRRAGGGGVVDCQPGGCGRDCRALAELSAASQVKIIACTGYHRQRYYRPDDPLWQAGVDQIETEFIRELRQGTLETRDQALPVRAGFVKAALEASLVETPLNPLAAAAGAAAETGSALLVHTEQGKAVEDLIARLAGWGVRPGQVILCHMDKRPDFGLHSELAREGFLLEYDTFYRPFYLPDANLWPLIGRMAQAGLSDSLALATDMADSAMWRSFSVAVVPGMAGILDVILPRLEGMGISQAAIQKMTGENISTRLATFDR